MHKRENVKLGITENDISFDTEKKNAGIGIDNIKERALQYNGTAHFVSPIGRGCKLTVVIPLKGNKKVGGL